ncbi:MAG: nickel pincer cofactor biosynthesis protein LarC [Thermodesulfovibrionales bacterium]|nr:nickel pincer cofactor biosynthesis protein LarC [Thermodesulfovibrionales bacterium]
MKDKIAYLDCFSGISGDMFLGALVDIGVPIDYFIENLKLINIDGYEIVSNKVNRNGISATKVDVHLHHHNRNVVRWDDIEKLISSSGLEYEIKSRALDVFKSIFEAEAIVHGYHFKDVHLHELGGIDCIVDVVGAIIGLDYLKVKEVISSSINLGSGFIKTSHGLLPVPAPATVELLKGFDCYSSKIPFELTTPTGASLIKTLTKQGDFSFNIKSIGYGAGGKDIDYQPNVLRMMIGEIDIFSSDNCVYVVETNIDDMNPQYYDLLIEKLFELGAKDVYLEQIIMKKSRPAIKVSVITEANLLNEIIQTIFLNTTTIGIRYYKVFRNTLDRTIKQVNTELGQFRIKVSSKNSIVINESIEYDDLLTAHKKHNLPLKHIERNTWEALKRRDQD